MKTAYMLVQWDLESDSENIIAVYLSSEAAAAGQKKQEAEDKKYGLTSYNYFVATAELIEE